MVTLKNLDADARKNNLNKKVALFPGTFDPVHYGHISILRRAAKLFDRVGWLLADNSAKKPMFTVEDRLQMMDWTVSNYHLDNVYIANSDLFTVDNCDLHGAQYIVRSFRMTSDFEYEIQMAMINRRLNAHIETIYIPAYQELVHISSTTVRELLRGYRLTDEYMPGNFREIYDIKQLHST